MGAIHLVGLLGDGRRWGAAGAGQNADGCGLPPLSGWTHCLNGIGAEDDGAGVTDLLRWSLLTKPARRSVSAPS